MKQAVILAAGKGIRMLPLTKYIPKPLVEINGKPFLYYLLKNLEKSGYKKVYIVVGHKKDKVEEFFNKNGFDFEIKFVHQSKRLGTGHAVKLLGKYIKEKFIVLMGDNFYSLNDINSIDFNDNYNYVFALKHDNPERFGVLVTKGDFLVEIEEKPEKPKTNLINAALYKFTPEIFDVLKKIKKSERGEYELTSAIDVLAKKNKVKIKELTSWVDLGKFEDIPKVKAYIKKNFS